MRTPDADPTVFRRHDSSGSACLDASPARDEHRVVAPRWAPPGRCHVAPSLTEINEVERGYLGRTGAPVLGQSFDMLLARRAAGDSDRETALRLLFLSWYAGCEPPHLTGLPSDADTSSICHESFALLGGVDTSDPEVCFAVGFMAELFPWCLGDEAYWIAVGQLLTRRAAMLQPDGPPPAIFAGRGVYGDYFAHMLSARADS